MVLLLGLLWLVFSDRLHWNTLVMLTVVNDGAVLLDQHFFLVEVALGLREFPLLPMASIVRVVGARVVLRLRPFVRNGEIVNRDRAIVSQHLDNVHNCVAVRPQAEVAETKDEEAESTLAECKLDGAWPLAIDSESGALGMTEEHQAENQHQGAHREHAVE